MRLREILFKGASVPCRFKVYEGPLCVWLLEQALAVYAIKLIFDFRF